MAVLTGSTDLHQFFQIVAPDSGVRVGAMPGRLIGDRQQYVSSFRYFFDFLFHNAHFGGIDFVVVGINGEERRFYLRQVGGGVLKTGSVEWVDQVVGILCFDVVLRFGLAGSFWLFARRGTLLQF